MKKLITIFIILLLVSCDNSTKSPTNRYEMINQDKWQRTSIQIIWKNKSEINEVCTLLGANDGVGAGPAFGGCSRSNPHDVSICEIYAPRPENFDDSIALENLGHEAWHCLGARHK
jgi:hypothetical protein